MIQADASHQDDDNGDDGTTEMPMGHRDDCAFFGFETAAEKAKRRAEESARANPATNEPVNLAANPQDAKVFSTTASAWRPLPEGWASVVISKSEWRDPQSGGPRYLHLRYSAPATITREDGALIERGMSVTQNLQVLHPTQQTRQASLRILAYLSNAAGLEIDIATFTPLTLHGAALDVKVANRPSYRGDGSTMPVVIGHRSSTDV